MIDRLVSLARLRRHTLTDARLCLARSLDLAAAAADCTAAIQTSITHELLIVHDLAEGDSAVAQCDAWRVSAHASLVAARSEQLRASQDVNRFHATVVAAHSAAETVEAIRAVQVALRQKADQRLEQDNLDEISQHRNAIAQSNRR